MNVEYDLDLCEKLTIGFAERFFLFMDSHNGDVSDLDINIDRTKGYFGHINLILISNISSDVNTALTKLEPDIKNRNMVLAKNAQGYAIEWEDARSLCQFMDLLEKMTERQFLKQGKGMEKTYKGDEEFLAVISNNKDILSHMNNPNGYISLNQLFEEACHDVCKYDGRSFSYTLDHLMTLVRRQEDMWWHKVERPSLSKTV